MTALRTAAVACAGLVALAGCGTSATPAPEPVPEATGELRQSRSDALKHLVQVTLTTTTPLDVTAVRLVSPAFAPVPPTPLQVSLPAGARTDLPASYGAADCAAEPDSAHAVVVVRDGDGSRELEVPLEDRGLLSRLQAGECAERALAAQATITAEAVQPTTTDDGRPALPVVLRLQRRASGSRVVVQEMGAHVVFAVRARPERPLLVLEPEQRSAETVVELVPSRCEPHALAENKRMGLIGLYAALDDGEPRLTTVVPTPRTRAAIEAFSVEGCRELASG